MKRYRVEITRPAVYFVDAETPEQASSIALNRSGYWERPDYTLAATAEVDVVAETVSAA